MKRSSYINAYMANSESEWPEGRVQPNYATNKQHIPCARPLFCTTDSTKLLSEKKLRLTGAGTLRVQDMMNNSIPEVDAIKNMIDKKGKSNTIKDYANLGRMITMQMQRNDSVMTGAVPRLDRKYASEIKGRRKTLKTILMAKTGFKLGDLEVSAEQFG